MAQASLQWREQIRQVYTSVEDLRKLQHQALRSLRHSKNGVIGLMTMGLVVWNAHLVLAAIAGVASAVVLYRVQAGQMQLPVKLWRRLWSPKNRPLTLAIAGGSTALLTTYGWLEVGTGAGNPVLAFALVLQGAGLVVLAMQSTTQAAEPAPESRDRTTRDRTTRDRTTREDLNRLMAGLSSPNPMRRLMAIRQTTRWGLYQTNASPSLVQATRSDLLDCFRWMLQRESDPILREALVEGIQQLGGDRQLSAGTAPLILNSASRPLHQEILQSAAIEETV